MNANTKINLKDDGLLEVLVEPLEDRAADLGVVSGYWKSDGNGHVKKLEPYFYLSSGGTVTVSTRTFGSISATLNLFNVTAHHGGPSFPQEGGSASLGPGQWRLYFTGSISTLRKSGIDVNVQFSRIDAEGEAIEPEEAIEEAKGAIFKARAKGSSRPQAIRIAYRRADKHAAGNPYRVLDERVYAESNYWICILTCELI